MCPHPWTLPRGTPAGHAREGPTVPWPASRHSAGRARAGGDELSSHFYLPTHNRGQSHSGGRTMLLTISVCPPTNRGRSHSGGRAAGTGVSRPGDARPINARPCLHLGSARGGSCRELLRTPCPAETPTVGFTSRSGAHALDQEHRQRGHGGVRTGPMPGPSTHNRAHAIVRTYPPGSTVLRATDTQGARRPTTQGDVSRHTPRAPTNTPPASRPRGGTFLGH